MLEAADCLGELTPKPVDRVVSTGEKLSCRFMSALLHDRGISSEYIDLSDGVDVEIGEHLNQDFYKSLAVALAKRAQGSGESVPVLTGYFGSIPGGLIPKIDRRYTNFCAALVAVGLRAAELQMWKEVKGFFTANPPKVPNTILLPKITLVEVSELTFYRAEIVHPLTMEQVIRAQIPIKIEKVINLYEHGTVIYSKLVPKLKRELSTRPSQLIRPKISEAFMDPGPTQARSPSDQRPFQQTLFIPMAFMLKSFLCLTSGGCRST